MDKVSLKSPGISPRLKRNESQFERVGSIRSIDSLPAEGGIAVPGRSICMQMDIPPKYIDD